MDYGDFSVIHNNIFSLQGRTSYRYIGKFSDGLGWIYWVGLNYKQIIKSRVKLFIIKQILFDLKICIHLSNNNG